MPMTPFTWKMHILLIPSSIRAIFIALDVPRKRLQNVFELKKKLNNGEIFMYLSP